MATFARLRSALFMYELRLFVAAHPPGGKNEYATQPDCRCRTVHVARCLRDTGRWLLRIATKPGAAAHGRADRHEQDQEGCPDRRRRGCRCRPAEWRRCD